MGRICSPAASCACTSAIPTGVDYFIGLQFLVTLLCAVTPGPKDVVVLRGGRKRSRLEDYKGAERLSEGRFGRGQYEGRGGGLSGWCNENAGY